MKNALRTLLLLMLCCVALSAQAADTVPHTASAIGLSTAFPAGWTIVTPQTVSSYMLFFEGYTAEDAADTLIAEGVQAMAFSPSGDAVLRVIAQPGDAVAAQFYDIERYTPAMRTAIKNDFLDKAAWALTGYRYSSAEWTNREGQGRLLNLEYTIRTGEETVARGKQAYTIRNGLCLTLDLQITGSRKITQDEEKLYRGFISDTVFPESVDIPPMPVGLTLTGVVPEETDKAEFVIGGESTKGALVTAMVVPDEGEPFSVGEATTNGSGKFKLTVSLPSEGDYRLYLRASLEGYAPTEEARWISYNARRLPVSFSSYPEGDYYESDVIISGKTISGVTVQCMEGDVNKKKVTGSDGSFSFKMDKGTLGPRKITLSLTKKNYDNRRFDLEFDRQFTREDYVKYLSSRVESLSFTNLTEKAEKYVGRLVKYDGEVLDVSTVGTVTYVQFGLRQDKESGRWTQRIVAVADAMEVQLGAGDRASLYIEVTTDTYAFPDLSADGDETEILVPAVTLLTYTKNG